MKIFSPLISLHQMNAHRRFARIQPNEHRCQVRRVTRAIPTMRNVHASISALSPKIRKPVCYNVSVGGNSAAALFDMVR